MSKKVTTVSIVENSMPQEMQFLIEELVKKSFEYCISRDELVLELDIEREKHKKQKKAFDVESKEVLEFRRKTEKFFENSNLLPIGTLAFNNYRFEYANYHIEAMCSAYKLFLSNVHLSISSIYTDARDRMDTTDYYISIKKRIGSRNSSIWHLTSKKENIQGLKNYFEFLTEDLLKKDKELKNGCEKYLRKYFHSETEEVWIKMIYLICNS